MKFLLKLCLLLTLALASSVQLAWAGQETAAGAKPAPKSVHLSGKVLETMDGGGYTYVLLKNGSEKVWVAAPLTKLKVGQDVKLRSGYEFKNFHSKALNRSFDKLIFSAGVVDQDIKLSPQAIKMAHETAGKDGKQAAAPAPAAVATAKKDTPPPPSSKPLPVSMKKIPKAKGPNGYTIAQLYAKRAKLEKKPVLVTGKVVKVTTRILKRNWIHLKDGSGSDGKKNNDIVVTTKDLAKEGDVITVKGTLYNRVDFGSGYRYELIIQDGSIVK
jgi:hypothetical protein